VKTFEPDDFQIPEYVLEAGENLIMKPSTWANVGVSPPYEISHAGEPEFDDKVLPILGRYKVIVSFFRCMDDA
jgi:hypothetical protein